MHFEQSYDLFMSLIRQSSLSHGWEIWKQSQFESHSSMCWDWPMSQHLLDLRALSYEALWSPRTACAHTAPTAQKWRSSWRVTHRNTRKTVTCKWVKWLRVGTKGCEEMGPSFDLGLERWVDFVGWRGERRAPCVLQCKDRSVKEYMLWGEVQFYWKEDSVRWIIGKKSGSRKVSRTCSCQTKKLQLFTLSHRETLVSFKTGVRHG